MAGFKLGSMGHWKVSKDKRATRTNHWLGFKENPPNCLHGKNLGKTIMTSAKEADVYTMSYTCHIKKKKHIKTIVKPMDFGDVSYFVEAWHRLARRCWLGAAADFRCWAGDPGKSHQGQPSWLVYMYSTWGPEGYIAKLVSNSKNWISFMIFYEYVWNLLL